MSSNYGEEDQKITIDIELVVNTEDVEKQVREMHSRERGERRIKESQREDVLPRGLPKGGMAPEDLVKDIKRINLLELERIQRLEGINMAKIVAPATAGGIGAMNGAAQDLLKEIKGIDLGKLRQKLYDDLIKGKGLAQGIAPGTFEHDIPNFGMARVPRGGDRPDEFIKKVKNPDAGLHIYGENDGPGTAEKIMIKVLGGPQQAQQALGMLKNPLKLAKFLGPVAAPVLAGLIAVEITKKIIKDMVRKGSIFDRTFKNVVDNRVEVLRTREQQQRILVGFGPTAQLITTTSAGTTNPRDSFNTYAIINDGNKDIEEIFAIRNDSGYN